MAVVLNASTYRRQDAVEGAGIAMVFLLYKQAFLLSLILVNILPVPSSILRGVGQ